MIFSAKIRKRLLFNIFICLNVLLCSNLYAQNYTRKQYIEKYRHLAIEQMERYNIPASIILAQACLESGNGNSRLAVKANNHFGIKCNNWNGKRIYHNDDEKGECFRKYNSVEDSFKDHSEFLRNGRRYASLFDLEPDDYKAWAHGLKAAGYATNPKYAQLLIDIIEKYDLNQYDTGKKSRDISRKRSYKNQERNKLLSNSSLYKYRLDRQIFSNNSVPYIVATGAESYASLAREYNLFTKEILGFNDLKSDCDIPAGTIVYIAKKKKRGAASVHVVQKGETMHRISQDEGIRLKNLYKLNKMEYGTEPEPGKILNLQ